MNLIMNLKYSGRFDRMMGSLSLPPLSFVLLPPPHLLHCSLFFQLKANVWLNMTDRRTRCSLLRCAAGSYSSLHWLEVKFLCWNHTKAPRPFIDLQITSVGCSCSFMWSSDLKVLNICCNVPLLPVCGMKTVFLLFCRWLQGSVGLPGWRWLLWGRMTEPAGWFTSCCNRVGSILLGPPQRFRGWCSEHLSNVYFASTSVHK